MPNPSFREVLIGLVITSFVIIFLMYLGGQLLGWDVTAEAPFLLGLALYLTFGALFATIGGFIAIGLWLFLSWRRTRVVWWVPGLLLAFTLGSVLALSGSIAYTVFGLLLGAFVGIVFWLVVVGKHREVRLAFE